MEIKLCPICGEEMQNHRRKSNGYVQRFCRNCKAEKQLDTNLRKLSDFDLLKRKKRYMRNHNIAHRIIKSREETK